MTTTHFIMGTTVNCSDAECGEVIRVVVDPVARIVTHIVVEPKHRRGLGRLVPLELVAATTSDVTLRCTLDEFEKLDLAEATDYLTSTNGALGYGAGEVFPLPYFGLGVGATPSPITYDKLPIGEVAIRRGDPVQCTDGEIGRVQGLVLDPRDHHVTHFLLQEGHFWGHEEVAIPISAVVGIESGIHLVLTKAEVQALAPVDVDHLQG